MEFTNFIGKWINSENDYELGTPPRDGKYNISLKSGNTLKFGNVLKCFNKNMI